MKYLFGKYATSSDPKILDGIFLDYKSDSRGIQRIWRVEDCNQIICFGCVQKCCA